jgi:dynein heavy chain
LNLESDCLFEENFFHFRSKVKGLEQFLMPALNRVFASAPTLPAQLRVLEMYQGISRRDNIKVR